MQHLYIIYFNDGNEVTPLCCTNGYTTADEKFEETTQIFLKKFFSPEVPYTIRKYKEINQFTIDIKSDISFPHGIAFSKKLHDACVYEKVCHPGNVYNSYSVKYIGRIGVISQDRPFSEQENEQFGYLKKQIEQKDNLISKQDSIIDRLEKEIVNLKKTQYSIIDRLEKEFVKSDIVLPNNIFTEIPEAPLPPTPLKLTDYAKKGQITGNVLDELKKLFEKKKKKQQDDEILDRLIKDIDIYFC